MGYFDSRARLSPPLRQQGDRKALRAALADGTIDALVSDHHPVQGDEKALPFAEAEPGASGVELLLSLTLKWGQDEGLSPLQTLSVITDRPARILRQSSALVPTGAGRIQVGGEADVCLIDPQETWQLDPAQLRSQGRHTPFAFDCTGMSLPARVRATWVGGHGAWPAHA